jgi:L-iditol 2-dehydrogenase
MATMQAARVHGPGDVRLDTVPVPTIGDDDVLVRVAACGICGTDLSYIAMGSLDGVHPFAQPTPIGHEFAGTVVAVGAQVTGVAPGQRVAVNPDRGVIGSGGPGGAMAPYIRIAPATVGDTLFPLPDHVDFAEAALAEPLSVALHGLGLARITPADRVAVIGAGPIGLCAVAALRRMGVTEVAVFDRVPARLDRARALGADHAIDVTRENMADALARVHGTSLRHGVPVVDTTVFVDAAGSAAALAEAIAHAPKGARIAVIALHKAPVSIDLFRLMAHEITLVGSVADDRPAEFGQALAMIADDPAAFAPMISHRYAFDRLFDALAMAADGARAAKVMLAFA